jgi:predicted AAA+ superfamily ATPase
MHTARCGNTCGEKCHAKGGKKKTKKQEFMYRDTTNVEHEMYDYTVIRGVTRIVKRFKEKFGSYTRKTFNRFTTKDSYHRNITHNMEILQFEI